MLLGKVFVKQTKFYGLSLVAERVLSFALLPVLFNSISLAEYGIWAQSIVATGMLTPIFLMGFQTALVRFFPLWETNLRKRHSALLAMLCTIFALLLVIFAITVPLSGLIANMLFGHFEHVAYVPLLYIFLVSEVLFEFLVGMLRATGRIHLIAFYIFLKGFWRIGIFVILLFIMDRDFYKAFLGFVTAQFLIVALMYVKDVPIRQILSAGLSTSRVDWGAVISFSIPLIPLAVLTGINSFTDRFFLTHFHGLAVVAVYAAAYSLAAVVAFFYSVLGFTLFPALADCWAQDRRNEAAVLFGRAILVFLFFLFPFIAVMAVSGQDILAMLTTTDHSAPAVLCLLLACNVGFFGLYQIAFYVALLESGSARALGLMMLTACMNILLNALLVPYLGMIGAALSGLVSNALLAGISLRMACSILDWRFPWAAGFRILLRASLMAAFIWLSTSRLEISHPLSLLAVLSIASLFYLALDFFDRKTSLSILIKTS